MTIPCIPFEEPGDLAQYDAEQLRALVRSYQQELTAAATTIDLWQGEKRRILEYLLSLGMDKAVAGIEQGAHYMRIWKTGERVEIGFRSKTIVGKVRLASGNGRSLMLEFDGVLGGYVGMMPVLEEMGTFRDLITRTRVSLNEPKEA